MRGVGNARMPKFHYIKEYIEKWEIFEITGILFCNMR